jgi:hypothetical protein
MAKETTDTVSALSNYLFLLSQWWVLCIASRSVMVLPLKI